MTRHADAEDPVLPTMSNFGHEITVWKLHDFSASDFTWNQNRLIQSYKNCFFDHSRGSELWFWEKLQTSKMCKKIAKLKICILKVVLKPVLDEQFSSKLISRKICVAEKLFNFHTLAQCKVQCGNYEIIGEKFREINLISRIFFN